MDTPVALRNLVAATKPGTQVRVVVGTWWQVLAEAAARAQVPVVTNRVGSMACTFFARTPVVDFSTAQMADTQQYAIFFREMLRRGVYLAPSQFEAFFVGLAHDQAPLDHTIEAAAEAFTALRT